MPDLEGLINEDDDAYIASRAIQFFVPGIPQVYYTGILAGTEKLSGGVQMILVVSVIMFAIVWLEWSRKRLKRTDNIECQSKL